MKRFIFLAAFMLVIVTVSQATETITPIVLASRTDWAKTIATGIGITEVKAMQVLVWLDSRLTKNVVEKKTILDGEGNPIEVTYFHTVWSPVLLINKTQITIVELDRQIVVLQGELAAKKAELEKAIADRETLKTLIPTATEE